MAEMITAVILEDTLLTLMRCFKSLHWAQWHSDNSVHQWNGLLVMESTLQYVRDAGAEFCLPDSKYSLYYTVITQWAFTTFWFKVDV